MANKLLSVHHDHQRAMMQTVQFICTCDELFNHARMNSHSPDQSLYSLLGTSLFAALHIDDYFAHVLLTFQVPVRLLRLLEVERPVDDRLDGVMLDGL